MIIRLHNYQFLKFHEKIDKLLKGGSEMKKWIKVALPVFFLVTVVALFVFFNVAYFIDDFIYDHLYFHDTIILIMKGFTFLSEPYFILLFFLCYFLFCLKKKRFRDFYTLLLLVFIGVIMVGGMKQIIRRNRPTIAQLIPISDFSFPSGHAFMSMLIYGYFIYQIYHSVKSNYKWIWISLFSFIIISVGFSRIYLGVHYTTDVLCGYGFGFLLLSFSVMVLQIDKRKQ